MKSETFPFYHSTWIVDTRHVGKSHSRQKWEKEVLAAKRQHGKTQHGASMWTLPCIIQHYETQAARFIKCGIKHLLVSYFHIAREWIVLWVLLPHCPHWSEVTMVVKYLTSGADSDMESPHTTIACWRWPGHLTVHCPQTTLGPCKRLSVMFGWAHMTPLWTTYTSWNLFVCPVNVKWLSRTVKVGAR